MDEEHPVFFFVAKASVGSCRGAGSGGIEMEGGDMNEVSGGRKLFDNLPSK